VSGGDVQWRVLETVRDIGVQELRAFDVYDIIDKSMDDSYWRMDVLY
jgi:hypothetical protein